MTNKELIRRALLGDSKAQEECTEKGITLPCPFCGENPKIEFFNDGFFDLCRISCHADITGPVSKRQLNQKVLMLWNTRPAPPIGRCGECKYFYKHKHFRDELMCDGVCKMSKTFKFDYNFCNYFEPKEGEQKNENERL